MKHLFTLILVTISIQAWSIKASVDFIRYSNVDQQYLEVNYRIFANSLYVADVISANEVLSTIVIYKEDEVVNFQKNMLVSGLEEFTKDLLDVRRFILSPGDYKVVVELEDQKGPKHIFKIEKQVTPGDVIVFRLNLISPIRRGLCHMHGKGFVNGEIVVEADLLAQIAKK